MPSQSELEERLESAVPPVDAPRRRQLRLAKSTLTILGVSGGFATACAGVLVVGLTLGEVGNRYAALAALVAGVAGYAAFRGIAMRLYRRLLLRELDVARPMPIPTRASSAGSSVAVTMSSGAARLTDPTSER
jgi:hypothetical protein